MSKVLGKDKELNSIISKDTLFLLPDSVFGDTTIYAFGDTVSTLIDGLDTTYILSEEGSENMFVFDLSAIYLKPGGSSKRVNQELYGLNVSNMFEHTSFGDNDMYEFTEDTWQLISDLRPQVLRFPDGSGGKFARMLGSENKNPDDDDYGSWNGGYGFNLTEIIPYYDITEGDLDIPGWTAEDVVVLDLANPLSSDWDWIDDQHVDDFIKLVEEYTNVFSIFPNPANTSFKLKSNVGIEFEEEMKIEIFDILGNIVSTTNALNYESVDISRLPVGVYMVLITNNKNETETKKLVKQK